MAGYAQVSAQLLVLPKFGASVTHFQELKDEVVYPMGGWGNGQPYFGLEVAYGLTNEWALGVDAGYLFDKRDLGSTTFIPFDEATFSQLTISARAKRALMDIFFVNAGLGLRRYIDVEFSYPEEFDQLGSESRDPSNFLLLNLGAEVIIKNIVVGTNFYTGRFFGDNASMTESINSAEVYVSYLFNIKVSKDPHWKKNCPKF
jgi:hypothetical protein